MIFDAQDFSRAEKCFRFPQLFHVFEPPRWPVRDAVKFHLEMGIRGMMAGESPELTVQHFIAQAARPGFTYPPCEPYFLAQDYASWLDGALRLIKEECGQLEQLPIYRVENHEISVEGWTDGEKCHLFRASASNPDSGEKVCWPELCVVGLDGREVVVHSFKLPSVRNGRLHSPLVMAHQHPTFVHVQYRLARLYDEPDFNKNWKRIARWEIQPNPSWDEWRLGIDRDKCLDQIRQTHTVSPMDSREKERLVYDISAMCNAISKPTIYPRLRENCQGCIFSGLCHGDEDSRAEYQPVGQEYLQRYQQMMADRML